MPYDPSPLLDFVPSFWRDYYENREQITRLWEAFARLMNDEFAQIEQVNNASNPGTCPDFIYHTYLYRKLEDWKFYGVPHSHYRADFRALAGQTIFYLGFFPDLSKVQVYLNGKLVNIETDPFIITFTQDSTQPGTNPAGARLIFEDPKAASTPITVVTDKWLHQTTTEITSAGLSSVSFPEDVDPDSVKVVIEKLNMTGSLDVTATGFSWKNLTPSVPDTRVFRRGETYEILDTIANASTFVTVNTETNFVSTPITNHSTAKIYRVINLDISDGKVSFEGNILSFSGQTFPVSMRVRAADAYGSESAIPDRQSNSISFSRSFDPSSQAVYFLNGRIDGGYIASASEVLFERSFMVGVVLTVSGAIEKANDHASARIVMTTVTDIVNLDPTRPLYLTAGLAERPEYPVLVFVDGVLQHPDTYTFLTSSKIQLAAPIGPGNVVDVVYVDLEEPQAHLHVQESFRVGLPTSALQLEDYVSLNLAPTVSVDGKIMSSPDEVKFSADGKFINFAQYLPEGTLVEVRGARPSYKYYHDIDIEIIRAAYLQNGIDQRSASIPAGWTIQLVWDDGFLITDGLLESDAKIEDAWFVDAYVDEKTAYLNFGVLLGLYRETSPEYVDVIRAVFSGNYMGSQPETIENYGCIILGSDYLTKAATITKMTPEEVQANGEIYDLMSDVPARVEPAKEYPKYKAISAAMRVIDQWDTFDALAVIGDRFSDDYTFAQTLDTHRLSILEGGNATFYAAEKRMDDPNVDFIEEEVWVGDLVAMYDAATPTVPAYGRITRVERHSIWADVPISVIVSGYGEGYYGQWVYGGGYSIIPIDSYKIWNRKTDRLDLWEWLDEALPDSVPYLASVLHDLLSAFVFLVEIRWAAVGDDAVLRDAIRFIDRVKPADTDYIPYTKPYEGTLEEKIDGALDDEDPTWTVVPNFLFVSSDVGGFIGVDGQVNPNVGSFVGP